MKSNLLKDFLRVIGLACIISGIGLFFITSSADEPQIITVNKELKTEISTLQSLLQKTEAELADLQTATRNAEKSVEKESEKEAVEDTESNEIEEDEAQVITFTLHIEEGMTSKDVATTLENEKIISDSEEFNRYLTDNRFSNKIQVGEYQLDAEMSHETIANTITKN